MEGEGERSLPKEAAPKAASMIKIIAIVVVIIVVVAGIAGVLLLSGGKEEPKNVAPTASLTADSGAIGVGTAVTFDGSESSDSDGMIAEYMWNFGDNTWSVTTGSMVTHTYYVSGFMIVRLTVRDDKGATGVSDISRIVVSPLPVTPANDSAPVAVILTSADNQGMTVKVNDTVSFDATKSYDWTFNGTSNAFEVNSSAIDSYSWLIGASFTNASAQKSYKFTEPGIFGVQLTVTDADGLTGTSLVSIYVKETAVGGVSRSDSFVTATIGEPESLDPAYDYETAGGEILQNVYETLVWYDGASAAALVPMLATNLPTIENGGVTPDGLNYTYNIRSGVKFHDGNLMDAYDVEYSIERVLIQNDPWSPSWMLGQVLISGYGTGILDLDLINASVTCPDSMTVVVHLQMPYPAFNYVMAYTVGSVVEKEYVLANSPDVPGQVNDFMWRHEMGTGPYMLKEWVSNQYILMERFDDYWRDPAAIKYVIIKKVEDVGTREMLLFSGEADSVYIPRQHTTDVRGRDGLRIVEGSPTFNIDFIGFNQNINLTGGLNVGNIPADFFKDVNVRKAFVHAFDYETFIEQTLLNTAVQPNGVIPMGMFGYNESVPTYDFNLTKAADYLKLTSWAEDGFTLTLFYNSGNDVREAGCFLLKDALESLKPLGLITGDIVISVQALDWSGAYLPAVRNKVLPIFYLGWAPDYADPDDYTTPFYHENGTYALRISLGNHTLTLKVMEAAYELNETLRAQMYYNISMDVYEEAYFLWEDQATAFHVERDWVQGYYFNPMYSNFYYYALSKT